MIKNKEKRLVCIIVLSLSIVSLVTAVVSGFVCGIVDFIYTIKDAVDSQFVAGIDCGRFRGGVLF